MECVEYGRFNANADFIAVGGKRFNSRLAGESIVVGGQRNRMGCYRICGVDVTTPAGACLSLLLFLICFQIFLEFVDEDDVHHHHYYPCKGCSQQQPSAAAADGGGRVDTELPHQHFAAWTEGTSPGSTGAEAVDPGTPTPNHSSASPPLPHLAYLYYLYLYLYLFKTFFIL